MKPELRRNRDAARRYTMAVAWYALVGVLAALFFQGPAPIPHLPETEHLISAERVREHLVYLLGPAQETHDAGSEANAGVRKRLITRLLQMELEVAEVPFEAGDRSMVNVIARRRGHSTYRPIVVVSHYDSCRFGPGAGDAMGCVAAMLESIRWVQSQGAGADLWFIFTDGEELGLLGADALVSQPLPWGNEKPFVINLDARGSSGAAPMFETHKANYGYIRALSPSLAWPRFTSSLMVNVYEVLPNKTDFTVFKELQWPGFNFALVAGAHRYHTLEDIATNLSDRSLQHFASHLGSLLKTISKWEDRQWIEAETDQSAIFFDLLGSTVISYPAYWNSFLSVIAWGAFFFLGMRIQGLHRVQLGIVVSLTTLILGLVILSIVLGYSFSWLLRRTFIDRPYVEMGEIGSLGYIFLVLFLGTTLGSWAFHRRSIHHARLAILFCLCFLATFTSIRFPGAGYLFHWPAILWAILAAIRPEHRWPDYGALGMMAVLHAPLLALLPIAMGPLKGSILAGAAAILLFPLMVLYSEFPQSKKVWTDLSNEKGQSISD